eukprot:14787967-Heterocapsa_arctica.AAC.1
MPISPGETRWDLALPPTVGEELQHEVVDGGPVRLRSNCPGGPEKTPSRGSPMRSTLGDVE